MRALVISDIHANITALEAVLAAAGIIDQTWCLGDVVGYGPDPNECINRLRDLPNTTCILGNHDAAVAGKLPLEAFNPEARASIIWTRSVLTPQSVSWLENLPESIQLEDATLAHGSPRNPVWEYLLDPTTASLSFDHFATEVCFVGHTHLPIVYSQNGVGKPARWAIPAPGEEFHTPGKSIINPGSVGQPRDRDARAAFGIYDSVTHAWYPRRVAYNIREVQERIRSLDLPARLAVRLAEGW
jgi:diadenosine tetraphosphatase ApaH/serine/threonine PP2A family protein phosphatase